MERETIADEAYEIGKAYKNLKKVLKIFTKLGMNDLTLSEVNRLIDACEVKAETLGRTKEESLV